MPQLDATTYFTQFFWLVFTYATFYIFLTKTILPKIAKVLYVRQQKAAQNTTQANQHTPTQTITQSTTQQMLEACTQSKNMLETTVKQSHQWFTQATTQVQNTQLQKMQANYKTHMQQSTTTFAHMANALKHTLPPSAQAQIAHPKNGNKAIVFQKAFVNTLFKA